MLTDTSSSPREQGLADAVEHAQALLASEPDAAGLFDRATVAFMRELLALRDGLAAAGRDRQLLSADDKTLLAELLIEALRTDPLASKELRLRLRGQLALHRLLDDNGGTLTTAEVAQLLGITPDAVRKRVRRGGLLAVPRGGHSVFPVFQLDVDKRRVVPGFDDILSQLDTASAPAKLRFFLTPDQDLGKPPIDALRDADSQTQKLLKQKALRFDSQLAA